MSRQFRLVSTMCQEKKTCCPGLSGPAATNHKTDDQIHQRQDGSGRGGRGASGRPYVHPLRPSADPRGRRSRTRWKASSVTTGAGAEAGGTWEGALRGCRAARLARVAAVGGAGGSASRTLAARGSQALYVKVYFCTERDGRKGPPAGNKARCNRTNTPHSKAMQRKAKPNQKPQTHTRGARQA
jgi:hypothetical protein